VVVINILLDPAVIVVIHSFKSQATTFIVVVTNILWDPATLIVVIHSFKSQATTFIVVVINILLDPAVIVVIHSSQLMTFIVVVINILLDPATLIVVINILLDPVILIVMTIMLNNHTRTCPTIIRTPPMSTSSREPRTDLFLLPIRAIASQTRMLRLRMHPISSIRRCLRWKRTHAASHKVKLHQTLRSRYLNATSAIGS